MRFLCLCITKNTSPPHRGEARSRYHPNCQTASQRSDNADQAFRSSRTAQKWRSARQRPRGLHHSPARCCPPHRLASSTHISHFTLLFYQPNPRLSTVSGHFPPSAAKFVIFPPPTIVQPARGVRTDSKRGAVSADTAERCPYTKLRQTFCRDGACPIRAGTFVMQNAVEHRNCHSGGMPLLYRTVINRVL